ncbi:MAG: DUF4124 domain-containing protein [Nevskiaceae bacterium]|nr:MAG: DUF4124 domain-containing protein [Nevskiaceae bacterium]TBR75118.1 MAG: DUF4124 domain-containing protein [Nevskiaceae bacterium]
MKRLKTFLICGHMAAMAVALVAANAVAEPVYRWVDGAGVVHFSSSPAAGAQAVRIDPRAPAAMDAPGITALTDFSRGYEKDAAARNKVRQAQLTAAAEREASCAQARQRISQMETATARRLAVVQPDGGRARMTQPEFEQRLAAVQAQAKRDCRS